MGTSDFKKKRGRFDIAREERRKRKGDLAGQDDAWSKRQKTHYQTEEDNGDEGLIQDADGDYIAFEDTDEAVFYGLLDPEEQTYYANVNTKIVSDDFESDQDRRDFIEAVYRESQGKELKLASSQSCSRYFERIITRSTPDQLKAFFGKLLGNLTHLVQHRFGSHVCETLFIQCAQHVGSDMSDVDAGEEEQDSVTMEDLLLQAAQELQAGAGYLLTDRFASHTVRVLLLVLSGEPLDDASNRQLVASRKKETLDPQPGLSATSSSAPRTVPKSFTKALASFTDAAVSEIDATWLRALATHPTGNPVLQLLLKLELLRSDKARLLKDASLFLKLLPLDSIEDGGETAKFLIGLTYDSTGSHLVEVLVQHLPGKIFKKLYKNVWKDEMARMAKNKISGYVAMRILERIGKDDLLEARQAIIPQVPTLLQRRRMAVIKCLIDRGAVRGLDQKPLAQAINNTIGEDTSAIVQSKGPKKADTHGSLLAQSMLQAPETCSLIFDSLLATETPVLLTLARDPAASRVIQSALTSPMATVGIRKQLIHPFHGHIADLAIDPVGSYLVDALWDATSGVHFIKERIADELAAHEAKLRDSVPGRKVWHNWAMDTWQRRRAEWRLLAKGQQRQQQQPNADQDKNKAAAYIAVATRHLTAMDLGADFAAYQQKVLDRLVSVTKTASHLASQDLGFHRSSSDQVSRSLDRQGRHLLELTSRLLKAAAAESSQHAPSLHGLDDIEDKWNSVVDVVDDQFEKADAALDESTGVIKRLSPAVQDSPRPSPAAAKYGKPPHLPKVLDKPQTCFNRQVNNFDTRPFKPLLTYKPHAIKSLEESIGDGSDGYVVGHQEHSADALRYNHPYALEIEQYSYPPRVYEATPPVPFAPTENTPVTMVDTEDAMLQMVVELKRAKEVAVDLEHHSYRSYVGIVCLMQISTRDKDWIIDTLKPWREKLQILNEVFADPKILKVFHGSNMDMIWLQRDLGLYVVGLFDTFYASDALNLPAKSLKYLLLRFANFEAQKQYQLADWRLRPLPTELIDYARSDTHYLLNVYDQLRNLLIEQSTPDNDLIDYVLKNSKKEALQVYERFFYEPESGRGSYGWFQLFTEFPNDFDSEQFAVFRALHEWRDQKARELDESPVYLLSNKALWTLAQYKPTNQTELYRFCRPVPTFVQDYFSEFKDAVFKAKRECKNDPPVREMIRLNEEKYGLVHNRWRKPRATPKTPQLEGVGNLLGQLREKGEVTGGDTQKSSTPVEDEASPSVAIEKAQQSDLWGSIPSIATPDEVQFALAFLAMSNVFPLAEVANSLPAEPALEATTAPPRNEVFTLREAGRKRKMSDATTPLSEPNEGESPAQQKIDGIVANGEKKKRKREEKVARKAVKQSQAQQSASPTVPFNYAAQPSLLTTQQSASTNLHSSAGLPMNPYAKAMDTSTGARQNKMAKELTGKSMTFKSSVP
ncbi:hypothetical protein DV738_g3668, partial [Chaetothyriales sp. CBS 135597]